MSENLSVEWASLNEEISHCRKCERLVAWRETVAVTRKRAYRDQIYWGKPVPGFGDRQARVLVVGLAPGAHGSNRTGRMFTGDASGDFLYAALHRAGFANRASAVGQDDGLLLKDIFISAVGRCAPPDNKPALQELNACEPFLLREMALLKQVQGVVALGRIAFERLLKIYRWNDLPDAATYRFNHGAFYASVSERPWLLASYHPSRQNTQTGRLTVDMFDGIWDRVKLMLDD